MKKVDNGVCCSKFKYNSLSSTCYSISTHLTFIIKYFIKRIKIKNKNFYTDEIKTY